MKRTTIVGVCLFFLVFSTSAFARGHAKFVPGNYVAVGDYDHFEKGRKYSFTGDGRVHRNGDPKVLANWRAYHAGDIEIHVLKNRRRFCLRVVPSGSQVKLNLCKDNRVLLVKSPGGVAARGGSGQVKIKRNGPFHNFTGLWIPLHKNGKNARKVPFANGQKHGKGYWYYPSGRVRYETPWNRGRANGTEYEYWDAPGMKKKAVITYVNGQKHGWEYAYDQQGRRTKAILWKRGKQVSK